jgi:hypothetical protein
MPCSKKNFSQVVQVVAGILLADIKNGRNLVNSKILSFAFCFVLFCFLEILGLELRAL